jgi:membrane protease YdiL (CAAX protease family)
VTGAGELPAALVFAALLGGLLIVDRPPALDDRSVRWPLLPSVAGGLAIGAALILPSVWSPAIAAGGLTGFVPWAAIAGMVASLEELVIRGRLQPAITAELGVLPALFISSAIFALIHLPHYGPSALPLDFAAGLALAGLRAISGRVLPCAVAHVVADWAAWFSA